MTDCNRCDAHRARWLAMTPARLKKIPFPIFAYQIFQIQEQNLHNLKLM